jgi:hypothetical protein
MWRNLRIGLLLVFLVVAIGGTWIDRVRTASWERSLVVGIYPIDGDGSPATRAYIESLSSAQFEAIGGFFSREARRFGVNLARPVSVTLHPQIQKLPPRLAPDAGMFSAMLWSLQTRYYAWSETRAHPSQIRIFVLYHDPDRSVSVPHSLGLQKGLIGVVYAFATNEMDGANNIVIAHELMHTLGATDKYDLATLRPAYPSGYAAPEAEPRYPQIAAEVMAGRRAIAEDAAEMPRTLDDVVVGRATAAEIGWQATQATP